MQRLRELWIAFKNIAIILSFVVNITLFIIIGMVLIVVFQITGLVEGLVDGLHDSFVDLNASNIQTEIEVDDEIPINFTLPLEQETNVVLSEDVSLPSVPAVFTIDGGGGTITGRVAIVLPRDTVLPIRLDLDVPVDQQIPINLMVPVDIALADTELSQPFTDLVEVVDPYHRLLCNLPPEHGRVPEFAVRALTGDIYLLGELEADNRCNLDEIAANGEAASDEAVNGPAATPVPGQDGGPPPAMTPTFTPFPTSTPTP